MLPAITPQQFIAKWRGDTRKERGDTRKERSTAQEHFMGSPMNSHTGTS
jgi:hypothetical protein